VSFGGRWTFLTMRYRLASADGEGGVSAGQLFGVNYFFGAR
jgi:hypothetical protein